MTNIIQYIPTEQRAIITEAINIYLQKQLKLNTPTDEHSYLIHDLITLLGISKNPLFALIPKSHIDNFCSIHGVDFPQYTITDDDKTKEFSIEAIIKFLKDIDVTGEDMEYIIKEVCMYEQIEKQLDKNFDCNVSEFIKYSENGIDNFLERMDKNDYKDGFNDIIVTLFGKKCTIPLSPQSFDYLMEFMEEVRDSEEVQFWDYVKTNVQSDYDRVFYTFIKNDKVIGINYHQGTDILDKYIEYPCKKLTSIFEMTDSNLDILERINITIQSYLYIVGIVDIEDNAPKEKQKFNVLKSFYGSAILEVEANSEEEAILIAENMEIGMEENLGEVKCEIHY